MLDFDKRLTATDYRFAIYAQEACNLSGLIFGWADAMQGICNETREQGEQAKRNHAINRLYLEQVAFLLGFELKPATTRARDYNDAMKVCEAMAMTTQETLSAEKEEVSR